jgi:hypothetical protein
MQVKCLCIEERVESFTGKRGPVSQRVITLMDASPQHRLLTTFDYVLSPEECERFAEGSLRDQRFELAITGVLPLFGGRLKVQGHIINAPLPQAA